MNEKKNFCFIRIAPLETKSRGAGSLGQALGHLDKHNESANRSKKELSHLNRVYIDKPKTYKECKALGEEYRAKHNTAVDEYNAAHPNAKQKRHMRNTATQFFEGVLTYSPDMEGQIDIDRWSELSLEFIKKEYENRGCEILRFDRHCDENSVHIQFVVACFDNEKQNATYRNIAGGRAELSQLQDRYGEAMQGFGLERGFSRYRAQEAVKDAAAKALGIPRKEIKIEQVKQYCADVGIEYPNRRKHYSLQYLRQMEQAEMFAKKLIEEAQYNEAVLQRQAAIHFKEEAERDKERALSELDQILKDIESARPLSECDNKLQIAEMLLDESNFSGVYADLGDEKYSNLCSAYNKAIKALTECDISLESAVRDLKIFGTHYNYNNLSLEPKETERTERTEQQHDDEER